MMRLTGLISLAFYLGCGALLHAVFVGAQFDWSSAWTWGWLFGWPIMLVIAFWAFILGAALLCLVITIGMLLWDATFSWRTGRQMRRLLKQSRGKR